MSRSIALAMPVTAYLLVLLLYFSFGDENEPIWSLVFHLNEKGLIIQLILNRGVKQMKNQGDYLGLLLLVVQLFLFVIYIPAIYLSADMTIALFLKPAWMLSMGILGIQWWKR